MRRRQWLQYNLRHNFKSPDRCKNKKEKIATPSWVSKNRLDRQKQAGINKKETVTGEAQV